MALKQDPLVNVDETREPSALNRSLEISGHLEF